MRSRLLEADILIRRGYSEEVLSLLSPNPPADLDRELIVRRFVLIGIAQIRVGKIPEAEREFADAERVCSSNCKSAFEIATARGILETHRGQIEQAMQSFRQSLQLARANGDRFHESDALLNLGVANAEMDRYADSIDWCNASRKIAEEIGHGLNEEKSLGTIAWSYYRMGDFPKAIELTKQAAEKAEAIGIERDQIRWRNNTGLIYYKMGQLSVAKDSFQKTLELAEKTNDIEQMNDARTELAYLFAQTGDLQKAKQNADSAYQSVHESKDRTAELYLLLVRGKIAAQANDSTEAEKLFLEVVRDPSSEAPSRWEAQNDLARLYEAQGRAADADHQYQEARTTFEGARCAIRHEEFRLPFLANATHLYDDYIHFLVNLGKTDQALQEADYSLAQTLLEGLSVASEGCVPKPSTRVDPQKIARQQRGTVLFYWLGQRESYVWAATPASRAFAKLPPAAAIESLVERYRNAVEKGRDVIETEDADGQDLYQSLVSPIQKSLRKDGRVVVVPNGALNNLNFETLLVPGKPAHFWLEDVSVANAASLRMLSGSSAALPSGSRLLLIGDPISPGPDYPKLNNAQVEIAKIQNHFPPGLQEVFTGKDATPATYLNRRPEQFTYIHFVAHGTASEVSPLESAVVLSRASPEENSFKLYARDIMRKPLRAELVTVSTCFGSGTALYTGEGLVGLSWGFLRAGARNVIGALWEVNDESTPKLMDEMYSGLRKGRDPQDALRAAKLSMLRSSADPIFHKPSYWAPFQLYTRN